MLLSKIVVVNTQNVEIYSQNYSYDANGLMTGTDHTEYVSKRGRVTRSYGYDTRDEITSIAVAYSTTNWTVANVNKNFEYVYDGNGNPLKYETPRLKDVNQNNMVIDTESDRLQERNFAQGFQAGAYNGAFNWGLDEGLDFLKGMLNSVDGFLSRHDVSVGGTVDYFGVNVSVGIGQGPVFQKAIQTPNLGFGVYGSWNPGGGVKLYT